MNGDFNYFIDSVLIETANRQIGATVKPVLLRDVSSAICSDVPPTWIDIAADRLRTLNFGELMQDTEERNVFWFEMNAAGFARSHQARAERRKPTRRERFVSLPWGKGAWDIFKIGLGVVIGLLGSHFFGK